jgi:homoserine O-succinyltransferase
MPLVSHNALPSFQKLAESGQEILSLERALEQDIRELHIGLLNMMPDAAFTVTERQFMRLLGSSNQIAQFYVHPFSVPGHPRDQATLDYIDNYYTTFDALKEQGLDALIITGANVSNPTLEQEPFWEPLNQVMEWATEYVTSVLCSCLSTHALMKSQYGIDRHRLPRKKWGVYSHRIQAPTHPLLRDINTRFDVVHSRYNEIRAEDLEAAGVKTLVASERAGVHMAVSPDLFRIVYFQGHPEYDYNSLLKEYKREVVRFINGERDSYPPLPRNYLPPEADAIAATYQQQVLAGGDPTQLADFPEAEIAQHLDNTWRDTAKAVFNNWLGLVYRLTNIERRLLFVDGVDPADPLGLLNSGRI